jgi:hypothetical protein
MQVASQPVRICDSTVGLNLSVLDDDIAPFEWAAMGSKGSSSRFLSVSAYSGIEQVWGALLAEATQLCLPALFQIHNGHSCLQLPVQMSTAEDDLDG